jgi:hypothetical protein
LIPQKVHTNKTTIANTSSAKKPRLLGTGPIAGTDITQCNNNVPNGREFFEDHVPAEIVFIGCLQLLKVMGKTIETFIMVKFLDRETVTISKLSHSLVGPHSGEA